jgi:hypothetical protein
LTGRRVGVVLNARTMVEGGRSAANHQSHADNDL